jgi:ubiquitin C-terminal hydrolase
LKRFRWTGFFRSKIDTFIEFPLEELDISPLMCHDEGGGRRKLKSVLYDLYAAIVHIGSGPSSGHYVAYAKSSSGTWCIFNDIHITTTSLEDLEHQHVYILFYRKRMSKT